MNFIDVIFVKLIYVLFAVQIMIKIIKLLITMTKIIFVKNTIKLIHNIAKIAKKIYAFIVNKIIVIIK